MGDKIGVLVIHGMGDQDRGYSNQMIRELKDRLKERAGTFEFEEIYWAKTLRAREQKLLSWMNQAREPSGEAIDLDWTKARRFVVHNLGDALAYHRDADTAQPAYDAIHDVVDRAVVTLHRRINDPTAPTVVIAHSLGAQIMSDYIWDQQKPAPIRTPLPNLLALITFGCNMPLFSLAYPLARPIQLPGAGIRKRSLKRVARWLNYLDADDVLSWPMRPLYEQNLARLNAKQKGTVRRMEDHEINVGSFLTQWNPGSHASYWTDNDLTRPVADYLKQLAGAL